MPRGSVVAIEADFSPSSTALLLALVQHGCVVVPLTESVRQQREEFLEIAQVEHSFQLDSDDEPALETFGRVADHEHYLELRDRGHAGLVLFSSGSTGKSKAAVHDFHPLLEKFHVERQRMVTISFLLYDHIGGVNTLLYTLSNRGTLVTVPERTPDAVMAAVEKNGVQLLPTSPTFLNLLLLSEAHQRHDLSSLELVTYGTEPMPETTLQRFHAQFPHIRLQQTYGLSEVGILRSKSKSSDSLWLKIGGEGFETRVVDGLLEIKARSAMLGYLNAPSPFTEDGWFQTGDSVEVDGEFYRILGRKSEMINVGGQKVYPTEVEGVIRLMDNVADVTVYGESNPIVGQIVCADVRVEDPESRRELASRLKKFCGERLESFKVPARIRLTEETLHSERFKKMRPKQKATAESTTGGGGA